MVRGEVLNNDKSHSCVSGKKCEKLLQRFESACGRADPDHTIGLGFMPDLRIIILFTHLSRLISVLLLR